MNDLEQRAKQCSAVVMELVGSQSRQLNEEIIRKFELMTEKMQKPAKNVDELVELQQCLMQAKSTDLQHLDEEIEQSRKR